MIAGPRIVYAVAYHPLFQVTPDGRAAQLERLVPGCEVHGWLGKWWRADRIEKEQHPAVQYWQITVALHSAWRLEEEIRPLGILLSQVAYDVEGLYPAVFAHQHRDWLYSYGRALCEYAFQQGELTQRFLDEATPYQVAEAAWSATRPWNLLTWRTGAGKTAGALAAIVARPGKKVLVICPAAARKEWCTGGDRTKRLPTSVEKYSNLDVHRVLPEGERRRGYEELGAYLERVKRERKRPVVVVGGENIADYVSDIRGYGPEILVIDEIHKHGDPYLHDIVLDENGNKTFYKAKTETGAHTRAVAINDVSRLKSIQFRLGLSATPLDDGRPRRLWAPLNLVSPGGFGRFGSSYAHYFCAKRIGEDGHPDDSGSAHMDELKRRCAFFLFDVPREESHKAMKDKLRFEVEYLSPSSLNQPDPLVREIKKLAKAASGSEASSQSRMLFREARLAQACSMKRAYVLARCIDFLKNGNKVMIYLARRNMADEWGEVLGKTKIPGWVAHGGMGPTECDAAVDAYALHQGACWLVGTWDAVGESKNGMQCTNFGVVAQLPVKPSQWIQGVGRWDRMDGVGTIVWVPVAEGTQDDIEVSRLVRKFGPVADFLHSPELVKVSEALEGLDDDGLIDSVIQKILTGVDSTGSTETEVYP